MTQFFVDMDGIIANFDKSAYALFDREVPEVYPDPAWIPEHLGITDAEFWKRVDESFWTGLELMPDAHLILQTVRTYAQSEDQIKILTSPSEDPNAYSGKAKWIFKHFPEFRRRIVVTCCKEACAGSRDHILIDDLEKNTTKFAEAGGSAILVPRPWNKLRHIDLPAHEWLDMMLDRRING